MSKVELSHIRTYLHWQATYLMGRNISLQQLVFLQQIVDWGQIFAIILRGEKSFHLQTRASDSVSQMHRRSSQGSWKLLQYKLIFTSESQKSKSLMPVLKFCCLLASLSFWLFSADLLTRNCHCSSSALRRAWEDMIAGEILTHQLVQTKKKKKKTRDRKLILFYRFQPYLSM